jgi:hypothetical protein
MPSTFASRGSAWLGSRLEALSGEPAKYRRGAADMEIVVVPCVRQSEDYGADGAVVVATEHDFKVDPTTLVIDSEVIKPQTGDLIIKTETQETFVVVPDGTENCWRWTDQFKTRIRIHTVERKATGEDG